MRIVARYGVLTVRNDKLASGVGLAGKFKQESCCEGDATKVVWCCLSTVADGQGRCGGSLTENQFVP